MPTKPKKGMWRRLYKYVCTECGKKRHTYIFKRFEAKECRLCKGKNVFDVNQASMFEEIKPKDVFEAGASLHYVNQDEK